MTNDETLCLTLSEIDYEDVKQQAELLRLEGKTDLNMRVIHSQMVNDAGRVLLYGTYVFNVESHVMCIPWESETCGTAVVQRIVDWALEQDDTTQGIVFGFLEAEDKIEALPLVLEQLGIGCADSVPNTQHQGKPMTMADIMRRALPATKDELITLVQGVSPETKRPASTVRQFIRQDMRKGKIILAEDGNYHLA